MSPRDVYFDTAKKAFYCFSGPQGNARQRCDCEQCEARDDCEHLENAREIFSLRFVLPPTDKTQG
jgi:hypothetical protein